MEEFLDRIYFDNTVKDYLIALAIIIIGFIAVRILRKIVLMNLKKWSDKTTNNYDDLVVSAVERFGLPALDLLIIYWGITYLTLSEKAERILEVAVSAVIAFFLIRMVATLIKFLLQGYVRKQEHGEEKVKQLAGVLLIVNIVVWIIGLVFLFDNLGYDVTAIIAGMGIGGIAIALAAQNILGDLFNYFVIFFDRPFEVGDFIIVDSKLGTVENIGIKTTRVKSLTGEQLVFSNSDLTNSRIHNYKRMQRRRIVFKFRVIYQTTAEQLREIPGIVKSLLENETLAKLDRAHFLSFGDSSLDFEVVYFVESADYNVYMDIQQRINLGLYEAFEQRGIDFAYPTRTVFLAKESDEDESKKSPLVKMD